MPVVEQSDIPSALLMLTMASSLALGVIVLARNPRRPTHQVFTLLTINLALWAFGVLMVHEMPPSDLRFWIEFTFVIACFLPATFYHFVGWFPSQKFEANRFVLFSLYGASLLTAVLTFSPWYIQEFKYEPGSPPEIRYGPVFFGFGFIVAYSMIFSFANLMGKLRHATGIERRRLEHVFFGIYASTVLSTVTNILGPVFELQNLQLYGPCFILLLVGILAYSMVRYHLMDIWVIVSMSTVYALLSAAVILIFFTTVGVVHWLIHDESAGRDMLTTVISSTLIVLVLQPLKERLQLILDRTLLKRRYNVNALIERLGRFAAELMGFEQLLSRIETELRNTMGTSQMRVLLLNEKDPTKLVTEYSTEPGEVDTVHSNLGFLLNHISENSQPIVLEELLHLRPTPERAKLAQQLIDMNAYLCVPLRTTSGSLGMLLLGEKATKDIYTRDDVTVFATISGPLSTAIENARLYKKLAELNLHLERIMSTMRSGVVAVNTSGVITTINQGAQEMLGDVETGQPMTRLRPEVSKLLEMTLVEQRGVSDFETVIHGPDGEPVPVLMSASALTTEREEMIGAMVLIFNMTQIKRLEANVQRADRLHSFGTVAAGMAHEIKNPLVSIKTFTQLLPKRYDDNEFRNIFSEIVPQEVERINQLVGRLLDFARPKPVSFMPQDLREIVGDVLALVDNQVRQIKAEVNFNYPDDLRTVLGDEQQLHQVFLNLILNALDAIDGEPERELNVQIFNDKAHITRKNQPPLLDVDCVKVVVSDSGCGITGEALEQVFTPFFTTKAHGSGLGLAVVHGIITEHGGTIDVWSAPGYGTAFTIVLPMLATPSVVETS